MNEQMKQSNSKKQVSIKQNEQKHKVNKRIIQEQKWMKKVSKFYMTRQKKVKDMVKEMQETAIQDERKKVQKILSQRKQKWRDLNVATQLRLPNFNHLKKQYIEFSTISPNASNQPFIPEKHKIQLANSDRAYSSTPNLKTGTFQNTPQQYPIQQPIILNQMFNQYDRLIDLQTPSNKVKALKLLHKQLHLPKHNIKNTHQSFDKNYFQKFTTHKFNIDKTNDYTSITSLINRKCLSDRTNKVNRQSEDSLFAPKEIESSLQSRSPSAKSKLYKSKKLKRLHSTLDSTGNYQSESLDCSFVEKSRNKQKTDFNEYEGKVASKRSIHSKTRIRSSKAKESRVNFAKNINSVQFS